MSKILSVAAANFLASGGSVKDLFTNFLAIDYTGTQPATAETAAPGIAIVRYCNNLGAVTLETRATFTLDFTSTTGNLTVLTVGGMDLIGGTAVTYSSPSALAAAVASRINSTASLLRWNATAVSNVVTVKVPKNTGTGLNGLTVVATVAAGSVSINGGSSSTVGGTGATAGVAAVNCMTLSYPAANGLISKPPAAVWQGYAGSKKTGGVPDPGYLGFDNSFTSGTQSAGWRRYYFSHDDPELTGVPTSDTGYIYLRYDKTIGTDISISGGTSMAFGAAQTIGTHSEQVLTNLG